METDSGTETFQEEIMIVSDIRNEESCDDVKRKAIHRGHYKCEKCNQRFTLVSNYRRHVRHNKICGSIKDGFKCKNCHKIFSLNATMKDHYARCIAEDPYRFECPNCPKLFTFKSSLNKHLRGRCNYFKKAGEEQPKSFKCDYCVAEFYTHYAYRKHVSDGSCTIENEPQKHVCPHCANGFTLKSSLNKHMKGRCKAKKVNDNTRLNQEDFPKIEIVVDITSTDDKPPEDIDNAYELINDDDVIEECPDDFEYETFETDDVESYIEIAQEGDGDTEYEYIKINDD